LSHFGIREFVNIKTVFVKLDKNIQIMRAVEGVYRTGSKEEIIG